MSDPTDPHREPESFADLPIQPTGSGVADLEIAYEQMKLAEGADDAAGASIEAGIADETAAYDAAMPTETGRDAAESAAHPS
ncbi:hypothetical protein GCM10011380_33970 [Sphingomonas metalli]|uniref:Uncharacterized protein n=1 Tax=Sphingomonas metalli TaxID=1779358 RepID=A0A916TED8_9SPHN|nr:hypothetical protein [Sphingomonas metalli]GGB41689.1 hypothetical protein GCM10011380_33970 [Sphingomonas metalli]